VVGGDGRENPSVLALIETLRRMGPPRSDAGAAGGIAASPLGFISIFSWHFIRGMVQVDPAQGGMP
jgi:hypothetical protein